MEEEEPHLAQEISVEALTDVGVCVMFYVIISIIQWFVRCLRRSSHVIYDLRHERTMNVR